MIGQHFLAKATTVVTLFFLFIAAVIVPSQAYTRSPLSSTKIKPTAATSLSSSSSSSKPSPLFAVQTSSSSPQKGKYEPKWKKKSTLAEEQGDATSLGFDKVGLRGTIPVVFSTIGSENDATTEDSTPKTKKKTSMAWAGQPLRDVATQAGQYIQYGCGKGECGTCECMMGGKWVRPCIEVVPADAGGIDGQQSLIIQVKAVKAKTSSSGTFFSIRSFLMGFWNNLLGMIGFVKFRRAARKNWEERQAYEDLVRLKTAEKRTARLAREAAAAAMSSSRSGGNNNINKNQGSAGMARA